MFLELVKKSRSYRGFDESRKVTRQELEYLVECARFAPSSSNIQALKFFLAWEPETLQRIQPLTNWAKALKDVQLPHPGKDPTAYIVICQDHQVNPSAAMFQKDVGIAAQTMLLAATDLGLGGCMIGNFPALDLQQALELPQTIAPMLVVALGKPDETVVLTELPESGATAYYRDENDVHYVPKRPLEQLVLNP